MTAPLLTAQDLHVEFVVRQTKKWPWSPAGRVYAVNGVSFEVGKGQTLGIVGESGCGKSTLIRSIAGLTPLTKGAVTLAGQTVDYSDKAAKKQLRQKVQMIFQDPVASLNPRMTIREIVREPLHYFRPDMSADEQVQATRDILDRVGIPQRDLNRFPHEFSGGQCQRIGIARALVAKPEILLCDEPVSALDVSIQAQVINLLKELQGEMGLTLIFVAHDLGVVRHISDEILVMYMGRTMEQADAATLIDTPQHPYSQALLSAVPVPDPNVKTTPQILSGELPSPMALPTGCIFHSRCPKTFDACLKRQPDLEPRGGGKVACFL